MIKTLQDTIKPLQTQLKDHPLYKELNSIQALRLFMQSHVYCVWDFMNLATTLQHTLSCLSVPWHPVKNPTLARLITSIKCEEESDELDGEVLSHFEYYIKSMTSLGADTTPIHTFLNDIPSQSYASLLEHESIPAPVKPFLNATYTCIQKGPESVAGSFAFGRETLIPIMFLEILEKCYIDSAEVAAFKSYLQRHIELDGDEHGDMAVNIVEELCGHDESKWSLASQAACDAIQARITLYDALLLNA